MAKPLGVKLFMLYKRHFCLYVPSLTVLILILSTLLVSPGR